MKRWITVGAVAAAGALALIITLTVALVVGTADSGSASDVGSGCGNHYSGGRIAALDADQTALATRIVSTAMDTGMGQEAAVIAVDVALVEAALRNPKYGDRTSLGAFQQQEWWGTAADRLDVATATRLFLTGGRDLDGPGPDGREPGLAQLGQWQAMPVGAAAQAVQRSAFPGRYALQEATARAVVEAIVEGLDCDSDTRGGAGSGDATGGRFQDEGRLPDLGTPRSPSSAVAWARAMEGSTRNAVYGSDWHNRCLNFVAQAYGYDHAGVIAAISQYELTPARYQHPGDRRPPPGALLYWRTGSIYGHVAIYLGDGLIASNDIEVDGRINIVPADLIEERWGARYVGWAAPAFGALRG